jgi:ribosomal protein S27AE
MKIVICPNCKNEVELKKHVNKCQCGARIKVLS